MYVSCSLRIKLPHRHVASAQSIGISFISFLSFLRSEAVLVSLLILIASSPELLIYVDYEYGLVEITETRVPNAQG